jgi:NhaP-type Na+/H+ or K+/H+ antiporter
MDGVDLTVLAVAVLAYAVVSGRLRGSVITPAMVFVGVGLAVGGSGVGWIDVEFSVGAIQALTTATLTLVLFTDALRIDIPALRQEIDLPRRLLAVGLPLTILAGTGLASRSGRGHRPVAALADPPGPQRREWAERRPLCAPAGDLPHPGGVRGGPAAW